LFHKFRSGFLLICKRICPKVSRRSKKIRSREIKKQTNLPNNSAALSAARGREAAPPFLIKGTTKQKNYLIHFLRKIRRAQNLKLKDNFSVLVCRRLAAAGGAAGWVWPPS